MTATAAVAAAAVGAAAAAMAAIVIQAPTATLKHMSRSLG